MTIRGTICFAPAVLFFLFPAAAVAQPAPPAFKADTNLVLAPVVVRDAKGEVVANLGKEDFRLFDNGKEREITSFSLEETSGRVAEDRSQPTGKKADAAPMVMPAHFVALMFDDVHIGDYGDLTYTRNAVQIPGQAATGGSRGVLHRVGVYQRRFHCGPSEDRRCNDETWDRAVGC